MNKSLLICISFHYNAERWKYFQKVLLNFITEYKCTTKIIVDTNMKADWPLIATGADVDVFYHHNLDHPFHLTFMHRQHIKDNIDKYDVFAYFEDDMLLPYENYLNYLENFELLWPKYVPSFIRIEEKDGEEYAADVPRKQPFDIFEVKGKRFVFMPFLVNYHAFWIMPQKELKETIKDDFVRVSDGREFAAMYVGWELGKATFIELENDIISKKCYSYHLPNNAPFVNLKVEDIFT